MTTQGIVLTLFGRTDVGRGRSHDEDAFVIADLAGSTRVHAMASPLSLHVGDRGVLFAVSDGMGGAQAGEVASSMTLSAVRQGMRTVQATSANVALQASVEKANEQVFDAAQGPEHAGMGATLTAVLLHGVHAYIAQVGDSRAYLLRAGHLSQLTHDQTYVQTLVDSGQLSQEQAETSEFKNVILQAMGTQSDIAVAMSRIAVQRHDRLLVCSDGLSGLLEDEAMRSAMLGEATLESACAKLVATAVERGSEDDITVIIADVDGEGAPAMYGPKRRSLAATVAPASA